MILSFKNKELSQYFETGYCAKIKQEQLKRLRLVLAKLHTAKDMRDMNFPGAGLDALSGNKKGYWSVSISGNWRVIFHFESENVYDVEYMDYH